VGENYKTKTCSKLVNWKVDIDYKFTAGAIPQQNHPAEIGFTVLAMRGRAIMSAENRGNRERYKIFREPFTTANLLDGLMVLDIDGKVTTRYKNFHGTNPAFAHHLRTWGGVGMVKSKMKTTPKIKYSVCLLDTRWITRVITTVCGTQNPSES
jgi:hypothetical protein